MPHAAGGGVGWGAAAPGDLAPAGAAADAGSVSVPRTGSGR